MTEIVNVVDVNNEMCMWGEKGVKMVKAKGWGSCWQTRDKGGWELVTTRKEAGSPSKYIIRGLS
jgi:hypothetical protein